MLVPGKVASDTLGDPRFSQRRTTPPGARRPIGQPQAIELPPPADDEVRHGSWVGCALRKTIGWKCSICRGACQTLGDQAAGYLNVTNEFR
jgi:hypothetical protein